MAVMKEIQFPVSVRWRGGRLAWADGRDKGPLESRHRPSSGGIPGYWSPEEMLVAATASCFVLTLAAVAERREAPLLDTTVTARGHVSRRADGGFGFLVIELEAVLETVPGAEDIVSRAAKAAEERCLITNALDVPVRSRGQAGRASSRGRRSVPTIARGRLETSRPRPFAMGSSPRRHRCRHRCPAVPSAAIMPSWKGGRK